MSGWTFDRRPIEIGDRFEIPNRIRIKGTNAIIPAGSIGTVVSLSDRIGLKFERYHKPLYFRQFSGRRAS